MSDDSTTTPTRARVAASGDDPVPGPTDGARPARGDDRVPAVSGVQSLDRAIAILSIFDESRPQLTLSEIADALALNTSTTHRLLQGLKAHRLVMQPAGGKKYMPGPALLELASVAARGLDVQELARPFIRGLRDRINETVGLHLLRSDLYRVVVDQAESHHALRRTYTDFGEPIPLHQGAPGKALLAFLDEEQREDVLARPLEAANANTIVDREALRDEIARIRERGYALSFGERVEGIHTVAVPIRNHAGHVAAAVSVTGPAIRMPADRLERIAPQAAAAALDISRQLGYESHADVHTNDSDSESNP